MKQVKAIFAVSLLLACVFMPCVAAAAGENEDETAYDGYADEIIETSPLTQNGGAHAMNDIRIMRGKNGVQGRGQGSASEDNAESRLMHVLDGMTRRRFCRNDSRLLRRTVSWCRKMHPRTLTDISCGSMVTERR